MVFEQGFKGAGEVGYDWLYDMPQYQPMAIITEQQEHWCLLQQVMKGWWVKKVSCFKMEWDEAL